MRIERGDGDPNIDETPLREFAQKVQITSDQKVFGDESDRISILEKYFKAASRHSKPFFQRLIGVRVSRQRHNLRLPGLDPECLLEQLRGIGLHYNFGFEVDPRRKAQELVRRPGIAVDAAVLAATIEIDTVSEGDIWAVILCEHRPGVVDEILCRRRPALALVLVRGLQMQPLKPVRRIETSAPTRCHVSHRLIIHLFFTLVQQLLATEFS